MANDMNLHEINKPLGELDDDTAAALFLHWLRGGRVQYRSSRGDWVHVRPEWNPMSVYRAAAEKPSIDWSHVSEDYNFLARDENGDVFVYGGEPVPGSGCWKFSGDIHLATAFASYKPGTCDWRDSLIERPRD